MRLYLKTSPNTQLVPFTYQVALVGTLHKWLGKNNIHDEMSLYSLSWLYGGSGSKTGLNFPEGAAFFISSPDSSLLKQIIKGVQQSPEINFGMEVAEAVICHTPEFQEKEKFFLRSPVLIKRTIEREVKFFFPKDQESDQLLTETLHNKIKKAKDISPEIRVRFDRSYPKIHTKLINYKGVKNKATYCPVILEGDPQAIGLAWNLGIGNSTGIGFGALK